MDNCDIYETVDFGEGPVRVRCTETGAHDDHKCVVYFRFPVSEVTHRNVFKEANNE